METMWLFPHSALWETFQSITLSFAFMGLVPATICGAVIGALLNLSLAKKLQNRLESKNKQMIKEAGLGEDLTLRTNIERAANIVIKNVQVSGYKIIKTKMAPMAKGGYRTYVLMEYPISLTYKNYLEQLPKESHL